MHSVMFYIALALFSVASLVSVAQFFTDRAAVHALARWTLYTASAVLIATGIVRFGPLSAETLLRAVHGIWAYFFLTALVMICVLAYLPFSRWRAQVRSIGAIAVPFITMLLFASVPFFGSDRSMTVITAHGLLPLHIVLTVVGELLFFLSAAGSLCSIVASRQLKRRGSMRFLNRLPALESIDGFNRWTALRSLAFISAGLVTGLALLWLQYETVSMYTHKEIVIYVSWAAILAVALLRARTGVSTNLINRITIALFLSIAAAFGYVNFFITTGFHSFQ
ncbi:MAG TPA: hypothetical protein PKM65_11765 [Spirochaetota bacterium]|nr:hypothetical protein [Spirochaetota bacterium]HNT09475.1 hypothetical protein [Spirochaetota bacterium]